jgi:hypothetical protein
MAPIGLLAIAEINLDLSFRERSCQPFGGIAPQPAAVDLDLNLFSRA